ncbi:FAD-dependent oxidoreductase [Pelobium manganitolerans]|uniref:FAD-dependent oxidoreductase n=1 Tax=Pelobium manganitolerans TaxID=1842495 RepID=UPI001FED0717|nr:FAD-dependent oxidoreductase [Pelobium manganitolerans]
MSNFGETKKIVKYIIIGAVAGGASTAARLRRLDEHAEIVIFEKGQYISYANCGLPYYIGNVIKDRNKLFVQTATSFAARFNVDVRVSTEVTAINPSVKTVSAINLLTGEEYTESYDKLVLSPGASPIRPALPGIQIEGIFTVRNVGDTDYIKGYVTESKPQKAVVIGAGFIGLEMAENLHELGLEVSVVEMGNQILAPVDLPIAAIAQKHLREKGIQLHLNTAVTGFEKEDDHLKVQLQDKAALDADLVILSIGVRPDTKLAENAGLKIGQAKGIWVNEYLQTSDPDIYAVGDAIEYANPISGQPTITFLAGPANKQGRICANNLAFGNNQKYNGSINTAIVKLFDLTVGAAGMAVKHLERNKIPHLTATIHGNSHAGYYPGAQLMTIQIAFSPENGQLLSAQVIGGEGVDKRLDVLSSVIKNKGTIYDLIEFEQAYAPPFSSAKDPVNMVGFVSENILLGGLKVIECSKLDSVEANAALIDVRTPTEFAGGTIEGAVNIPLDEIRNRLTEVPTDKPLHIFCQQGMRGYLAQRILVQSGFRNVTNLSGGYLLWKTYKDEMEQAEAEVL